jgi:Cyclic nucleotide-binding domain
MMFRALVHCANLFILGSFLVRDILWLRALSILAGLCFIGYFTLGPTPSIEPVLWNALFIALNAAQIVLLLRERSPIALTDDEARLHRATFRALARRPCARLLRAGRWRDLAAGEALVEQGEALSRLMVLCTGTLEVLAGDKKLAELHEGRLVGEMCFVAGGVTSARVVASEPSRVLEWDSAALRAMFDRDPSLRDAFTAVVGRDLVHKLRGISGASAARVSLPHE